ncbi:speckle-type POZ protein-like A [Aphidius gifuensis]|uniref:speckle-type POZ protein-like A n=1 Tax=Aphidius gifuensis TaxID=684658 RepID=UPI001CDBFE49|nr:speckle-type POZ protein-like A [Aphidius gifuensis]
MSIVADSDSIKLTTIKSNQDTVTGMENCEFTYEWTIKNCNEVYGDKIKSPSFSSHYSGFDDEWILTFCPTDDQSEYIFRERLEKIKWDGYISTSDFVEPENGYVQNNELKICCTITMSKKLTNKSNVISSIDARKQLSVDWKKLFLSEKSADVTIKVGQKSFRAIKGILAVRSPVFAAMFSHEKFKENEKNEVVIEDVEEDVFEEFLHFIYTGESPKLTYYCVT